MFAGLANITTVAFALRIKAVWGNSVVNGKVKAYKAAKLIGCSPQTFGKQMARLSELGLLQVTKGHRRVVNLGKVIKTLFPQFATDKKYASFKHCRFFSGMPVQPNVKLYKDQIELALLKLNADQQAYHIESKQQINKLAGDRTYSVPTKQYKALLKRYNATDLASLHSRTSATLSDTVNTGKNHFAGLLGSSASTASNRLRKWHKIGAIVRKIKRLCINMPVSYTTTDAMRDTYGYALPNVHRTGFWVTLGSSISFPTKGRYM